MTEPSTFEELLRAKGVVLRALGLDDVGLRRDDALAAAEAIRASSIAVLGGDVYFLRDGAVEQAFASWHSDRRADEGWSDFVERAYRETRSYLSTFPRTKDATPLFVLVVAKEGE